MYQLKVAGAVDDAQAFVRVVLARQPVLHWVAARADPGVYDGLSTWRHPPSTAAFALVGSGRIKIVTLMLEQKLCSPAVNVTAAAAAAAAACGGGGGGGGVGYKKWSERPTCWYNDDVVTLVRTSGKKI